MIDYLIKTIDRISDIPVILAVDLAPWLVIASPCYAIARSLQNHLAFEPWIAWLCGLGIEGIGIGGLFMSLQLFSYNATRSKSDPPAPLTFAYLSVAFYIGIGIALTLGLGEHPSVALLFGMGLCAYTIQALRVQHQVRLAAIRQSKEERKEQRHKAKEAKAKEAKVSSSIRHRAVPGKYDNQVRQILAEKPDIGPGELGRLLQCNPGTAYKLLKRLRDNQGEGVS